MSLNEAVARLLRYLLKVSGRNFVLVQLHELLHTYALQRRHSSVGDGGRVRRIQQEFRLQ